MFIGCVAEFVTVTDAGPFAGVGGVSTCTRRLHALSAMTAITTQLRKDVMKPPPEETRSTSRNRNAPAAPSRSDRQATDSPVQPIAPHACFQLHHGRQLAVDHVIGVVSADERFACPRRAQQ